MLTALLLHHLRQTGIHAIAIKPFCCGSRVDLELFQALQGHELEFEEICPYFFDEQVAPLLAARMQRQVAPMAKVLRHIRAVQRRCELLLVEGIGGLLVPLGETFMVRDLICELGAEVILVGRTLVGTINHTLLSAKSLFETNNELLSVVLMNTEEVDFSSTKNAGFLKEILQPTPVWAIPFLGKNICAPMAVKNNWKKNKKVLARIVD